MKLTLGKTILISNYSGYLPFMQSEVGYEVFTSRLDLIRDYGGCTQFGIKTPYRQLTCKSWNNSLQRL
ncbi:MAG: hypothetical protein PHY21_04450 [Candidatus Cloacimonetes bacterium]|nr:hypothetical protein [Candidatus Cloacimonadota bacterium]MDD2683361.1 hypothetical protein [Candidatus Cloacimonadota bacterium]